MDQTCSPSPGSMGSSGSLVESGCSGQGVIDHDGATMPIAIVGMSCRFPGDATSPEKLWKLCAEARSAWSEIPKERYNQNAFYHPQGEKLSTSNVRGAHFLVEDVSLFDASFFNFSSEVAATMDPQFRLQLEIVFEAFESAGLSLQQMAGSETSVFAGAFFRDHHDSLMRDPETLPRYFMTGNGAAMASNRLSHFFDLRGPSMTVDTGCSTALAALHLACHSLRTGDSTASVVGGANLMLNPDMFVSMSSLGFLSPDGKSYAFDSRANGYGRGEGVSAIVIKPLHDAIRDGDPIRAVIRETAINQDGKTPTLTSPSQEAQEKLIRSCYQKAGLNPLDTAYVEAHGTGTQAGDPVESGAIAKVFNQDRPAGQPLLIGSVKTNIGHTEAASGLAAVIKATLALEKGCIPPSINFEKANEKIPLEKWGLKVPRRLEQWPSTDIRRASINNFGYGGTNAHVIIEEIGNTMSITLPANGIESNVIGSKTKQWRLFTLSARDEGAVKAMTANLQHYIKEADIQDEDHFLQQLAHTLGNRRSEFDWVVSTPAPSLPHLVDALGSNELRCSRAAEVPRIGFCFTGQGAQWHAMGRELIDAYPVFKDTLIEGNRYLEEFGAKWSLIDELEKPKEKTRVNEAAMGLVLCTAVQVALVRLLQSWGIVPTAVTSHSSGEIAAAFSVGVLSVKEAIAICYLRGEMSTRIKEQNGVSGGMLAVGLGREDTDRYIERVTSGKVVVACVNSPSSTTVSGDLQGIYELEDHLTTDRVFARKLKVRVAYHSHHMLPFAEEYTAALKKVLLSHTSSDLGGVIYSSPVSGERIQFATQLAPENWVRNMTQPVLFSDSFRNMCLEKLPGSSDIYKSVDMVIEVGPHGALAGPIRQICITSDFKNTNIAYTPSLVRDQNAVESMQNMAANLLAKGYRIDLNAVNFACGRQNVQVIHDLPSYPWNHAIRHWTEPRVNSAHRNRQHAYHDLIGMPSASSNPFAPSWRGVIKVSEVPWVRDHQVQSSIVYPAAGFVCMAVEGARQVALSDDRHIAGFQLRDIDVLLALIVPSTPDGVEVQLAFRKCSDKALIGVDWLEFEVLSVDTRNAWKRHCKGLVSVVHEPKGSRFFASQNHTAKEMSAFPNRVDPKEVYKSLQSVGIYHGPIFQNLFSIETGYNESVSSFAVADTASLMPYQHEHDHVLHPTTLDSIFQAAYSTLPRNGGPMAPMVPRKIEKMSISNSVFTKPGDHLTAYSTLHSHKSQGFQSSVMTFSGSMEEPIPLVELTKLYCQSLDSAYVRADAIEQEKLCMTMCWGPDLTLMTTEDMKYSLQLSANVVETTIINDMRKAVFHFIRRALNDLTDFDQRNFSWHQKAFYKWMKTQNKLADFNLLGPHSSTWAQDGEADLGVLFESVRTSSVNGEMTCRVGNALTGILRNQIAPLKLMLEGKLLYSYYEKDMRMQRSYGQVEKFLCHFVHKNPRANVLEIGAGTGGCTTAVLKGLGGHHPNSSPSFVHYDFTDISPGFFGAAREKFAVWGDMMSYKAFDIEGDASHQGFEDSTYDLVVACRVLHATKDIESTMRTVRKLLKAGGRLILVEDTKDALDTQLVFGTLPGWWLSQEAKRKLSPTLKLSAWSRLLKRTGYNGIDVEVHDREDETTYSSSVILASADGLHSPHISSEATLICGEFQPPQAWLDGLSSQIAEVTTHAPLVEQLNSFDPQGKICVILVEMYESVLKNPTPRQFHSLQSVLTKAKGVLWISRGGAIDCSEPDASIHIGLLRTLRCENSDKKYISLDLDPSRDPWTLTSTKVIRTVFGDAFDDARAIDDLEVEYAERDGSLHIPRICEDAVENANVAADSEHAKTEMQPFHQPERPIRLEPGTSNSLDRLSLRTDPEALEPLPEGFVEILPKAFGLNFRDVMVAMGQLETNIMGFECSGVVTKLGPGVSSGLKVGARVCALTRGYWGTFVRVHSTSVAPIPNDMTFEVAASVPMVFVTAYISLFHTARLQKGESVLIHAAAGGVGQAAIMLAQRAGAEVYGTVGSSQKRRFLTETYGMPGERIFSSRDISFATDIMSSTSGKGVDVVLNSLAGPLLQETWNCIARFGRFVEIGKRDLEENKNLEMAPFTRSVSFAAIDLIEIGTHNGKLVSRVLAAVLDLLGQKAIRPISPLTVYSIQEIEKAFRMIQTGKHIGKIVIKPNEGDLVKVLPTKIPVRLSPSASYLIIGGLGGIGRSISGYMVEHGARNLILTSRSASSRADADAYVCGLRKASCKVVTYNCDVSDANDLARVLKKCQQEMAPIRGVVQAAMDSIFEAMTLADYNAALNPKVLGSWNLNSQLSQTSLDFFIMLSSFAAVGGNASQANYAAGGSYQDALARHRSAAGLPAVVLDLGMVKSIGYVAERKGVEQRLKKLGYRPLEEDEVLRLVDSAIRTPMRTPQASQVITGFSAGFEGDIATVPWRAEPRFSRMREVKLTPTSLVATTSKDDTNNLKDAIGTSQTLQEAVKRIGKTLAKKLSEMFMISEDEIDMNLPIAKYGVDSLVAVELRNWLVSHAHSDMSIFNVMQSKSIWELAEKTASQSKYFDHKLQSSL